MSPLGGADLERGRRLWHQLHRHSDGLQAQRGVHRPLLSHRRDEFVLATECGCTAVRRDETPHVWIKENVFRGLDEGLARKGIDYVDVM
jgi:hypothetical protein